MAKDKNDPTLRAWLGDDIQHIPPDQLADALDLLYAAGPPEEASQQALDALRDRVEELLPARIYYDSLEGTPLGRLWLAVGPKGLVAVHYGGDEAEFVNYLEKEMDGRFEHNGEKVAAAAESLQQYLRGEREQFELDVDLSTITAFQRQVLEETRRVTRGEVATYAEIAKRIGKPKAFRAVGQALRRNPIPIVVPCHRVVASDGTLGGYGGQMGDERKIKLLKLEGVVFA